MSEPLSPFSERLLQLRNEVLRLDSAAGLLLTTPALRAAARGQADGGEHEDGGSECGARSASGAARG